MKETIIATISKLKNFNRKSKGKEEGRMVSVVVQYQLTACTASSKIKFIFSF